MKFNSYPHYKDSKIEWIAEIPDQWEVKRIADIYLYRNEKVSDKDFKPLSVTKKGIVPQLETAAKTIHGDDRKRVEINDFVINSRSDRRGSCGVSRYRGSVSLISHVLENNDDEFDADYGHFLFRNEIFSQEFYRWGRGIVDDLWSTRWSDMKKIMLPYPPLKDQIRIADFLDKETSKVDLTIEKYEKLIELLKEKRISLISHVVTKGLDKDVEMRDSGVEWIGKIPKNWKINKIKYISPIYNEKIIEKPKNLPYIGLENIESWTGELILDNPIENVDSTMNFFHEGAILLGKLRPYLAKSFVTHFKGVCSTELLALNVKEDNNHFIHFQILSKGFIDTLNSLTYGVKMPRSSPNDIENMELCVPPIKEQNEIVFYLNKETNKNKKLIKKIQSQISLLKEYKISLISHAVTGKIDVRE